MKLAHRQRWGVMPTCPPQLPLFAALPLRRAKESQRRRKEAIEIQQRLRGEILTRLPAPLPRHPLVAGADISYDKNSDKLFAAVVVGRIDDRRDADNQSDNQRWRAGRPPYYDFEYRTWRAGRPPYYDFEIVETATVVDRARFPYVPGLLSFREAPVLLKCFRKLRCMPDVVMIDGHGLAHPRRFGIACHIGWLLDVPTIGCGKSILVGEYKRLGQRRGAIAALVHKGEVVGCAVRTRTGVQPVYISIGHKIDLPTAVRLALRCAPRVRIPEPTRQAHLLVNRLRVAGGTPTLR